MRVSTLKTGIADYNKKSCCIKLSSADHDLDLNLSLNLNLDLRRKFDLNFDLISLDELPQFVELFATKIVSRHKTLYYNKYDSTVLLISQDILNKIIFYYYSLLIFLLLFMIICINIPSIQNYWPLQKSVKSVGYVGFVNFIATQYL